MPATQIYFKQKTFAEARQLSEAIGRTTVEEATVNDSGRVHELVQGRALITPDELINLKNEVIVFTADTKPLKLPLTSPTAYEHALAYDAPERKRHAVSEFVRRRGDISSAQSQDNEQQADYRRKSGSRNQSDKRARPERSNKKQTSHGDSNGQKDREANRQFKKPSSSGSPDFGD